MVEPVLRRVRALIEAAALRARCSVETRSVDALEQAACLRVSGRELGPLEMDTRLVGATQPEWSTRHGEACRFVQPLQHRGSREGLDGSGIVPGREAERERDDGVTTAARRGATHGNLSSHPYSDELPRPRLYFLSAARSCDVQGPVIPGPGAATFSGGGGDAMGGWIRKIGGVATLLGSFACTTAPPGPLSAEARPNVLFIIADDLGFGDLGVYGAEVETPVLDALAASGVQLTNFHTAATCSPSRSMLLTGVDNHRNGLGSMGEFLTLAQRGAPGYEGYLNDRVQTLGERLAAAGYFTAFSGKWHLGMKPESWPAARGFQRSFALLDGSGDNWSDIGPAPIVPKTTFTRNGKQITRPPGFSSALFVDELLAALDAKAPRQPFLAVLSFQAVHWPHQAPADVRAKYEGAYDAGWDAVRAARHARMLEMGLIGPEVPERGRDPAVPSWSTLSEAEQRWESARMAAYAAMTDDMDRQIGRVLDALETAGELQDTIVVFVSDNGADPSEPDLEPRAVAWYDERYPNRSIEGLGGPGSFPSYGPQWAQLGSVFLRDYKGSSAEGGMRVPFIIRAPGRIAGGRISPAFAFATDVVPTLLELTGVPAVASDRLAPIDGSSMVPMLRGESERVHAPDAVTGYELMIGKALFQGDRKLVQVGPPAGDGTWMLFDIVQDPGELADLREQDPADFERMRTLFDAYVAKYGVIPMDPDFDVFEALTSDAREATHP